MRTLLSLLALAASLYLLLGLMLYLFQGSMVFLSGMPGRVTNEQCVETPDRNDGHSREDSEALGQGIVLVLDTGIVVPNDREDNQNE